MYVVTRRDVLEIFFFCFNEFFPPQMSSSLFPIREISTYTGRNWTVKARVTSKSQMRTFSNDRGSGKVFSVDLLDKDGGEIKASFFNASADKFYPEIEAGKIYTFSKGNVKVANKRYSTSKHNYEINFDAEAVITVSPDDDKSIETVKFSFTKIREISTKNVPCTIDLIGVVKDFRPIGKIVPKNGGEELTRRSITLVDDSECAIEVTLWQDSATKIDEEVFARKPIIAIKGVSVKEYNGSRTCGTLQQSMIELVTETTEFGKEVYSWWSSNPNISDFHNLSAASGANGPNTPSDERGGAGKGNSAATLVTSIADMREECKRGFFGDKGVYFDIVAKLSFVSTKAKDADIPIHYSACPSCNRKLSDDGTNRCFACDKTVQNPKLKYLLRAQFIDHSDQCYLSVFDAQALTMLKRPVETILQKVGDGQTSLADEVKKSYFEKSFQLRVRATAQEYKGEIRPRVTVISADPVDPAFMGNKLLKKIFDKIGATKHLLDPIHEEKENEEPSAKKLKTFIDETNPAPVVFESKE